jgi:hypothetical protein
MKAASTKLRRQLLDDAIAALADAKPGRVLALAHEMTSQDLNLFDLARHLKERPGVTERVWDTAQKALFKFVFRIAARKDIQALQELLFALEQRPSFIGDDLIRETLDVSLREVLTPRLFPTELTRELPFRILRKCPPAYRSNCFEAIAESYSDVVKLLDERRYDHLVSSDFHTELARRQQQIKEELVHYYSKVRAEDLVKILGYISEVDYILRSIADDSASGEREKTENIENARRLIRVLYQQVGLRAFGAEDAVVGFDPAKHESARPLKTGTRVEIDRPGLAVYGQSGDLEYVVRKAQVRPI